MPCIHGKDGNVKVSQEDKMEVWKQYKKLLNEDSEWSGGLNVKKNEELVEECLLHSYGSTKSHEKHKSCQARWSKHSNC